MNNFPARIIVFLLIGLCGGMFRAPVWAQEEGFQWGQTVAQSISSLNNKQKEFYLNDEQTKLVYPEKVLGEPCDITLYFDAESKLLNQMEMTWKITSVGARMRDLLKQGYGEYLQLPDGPADFYIWERSADHGMVTLDYSGTQTSLNYYDLSQHPQEQELTALLHPVQPSEGEVADEKAARQEQAESSY